MDAEAGVWPLGRSRDKAAQLGLLAEKAEAWLTGLGADVAAVESPFQHRNVRSALVLAEARGVILSVLGRLQIPVVAYPPATVKKTVCGFGGAGKEQVRRALGLTVRGVKTLALDTLPDDATDALAVSLCHHVHGRFAEITARGHR